MTSKSKQKSDMPSYLRNISRNGNLETRRLMEIYEEGITAAATIMSIDEAGTFGARNYYKITLLVSPPHSEEFTITGYAPVSGNLLPKIKDVVNIKYDPQDAEKFVII